VKTARREVFARGLARSTRKSSTPDDPIEPTKNPTRCVPSRLRDLEKESRPNDADDERGGESPETMSACTRC
jgi:hypothetical protein